MFILRKISGDGVQMNFSLGESYTLITKESNPEDFKRMSHKLQDDCIYGFVIGRGGANVQQLSDKQQSYVMTYDGKTFANVTKR